MGVLGIELGEFGKTGVAGAIELCLQSDIDQVVIETAWYLRSCSPWIGHRHNVCEHAPATPEDQE